MENLKLSSKVNNTDIVADRSEDVQENTTDGMTSKVVKGSVWVLLGQVFPLIATFIASPFVIRYLGSEAYGILLLVGMIPGYFGFADFGMGLASTRFGSEEYGKKSATGEKKVIRTALFIAFISALLIALPLFIFSKQIVENIFSVQDKYLHVANIGLKITSITFFISILGGVLNTPQLSRLKMNLNVLVNAGPKIVMIIASPIVIYYGGGIIGAASVTLIGAVIVLMLNIFVSGRLLPGVYHFSIDRKLIKPLIKFGKNAMFYSAAYMLICNLEKVMLPRLTEDTRQLAYYSIAFTLAGMTTMFTLAIGQTLIPAFSQMLAPEKKAALNLLFSRSFRGCIILLLPLSMLLIVIAQPFFQIWAGPEFGRESIIPFYILMGGVFFSLMMFLPNSILLAKGRTDLFAKTYWVEVIPYFGLAYLLINSFGIAGAAMAWSIREIVNALLFYWFSKKFTNVSYDFGYTNLNIIIAVLPLSLPVLYARLFNNYSWWLFLITPVALFIYFFFIWKNFITIEEKEIVKTKVNQLRKAFFRTSKTKI